MFGFGTWIWDLELDLGLTKSYWWGGGVVGWWWPVGLYFQPQSHSFSFGLSILNLGLGFGTWIWDLDLGLDLGLTILLYWSAKCIISIILLVNFYQI